MYCKDNAMILLFPEIERDDLLIIGIYIDARQSNNPVERQEMMKHIIHKNINGKKYIKSIKK